MISKSLSRKFGIVNVLLLTMLVSASSRLDFLDGKLKDGALIGTQKLGRVRQVLAEHQTLTPSEMERRKVLKENWS
jgi:hypothetical protein